MESIRPFFFSCLIWWLNQQKKGGKKHDVECFRIPFSGFPAQENPRSGGGFEIWETVGSKKPLLGLPNLVFFVPKIFFGLSNSFQTSRGVQMEHQNIWDLKIQKSSRHVSIVTIKLFWIQTGLQILTHVNYLEPKRPLFWMERAFFWRVLSPQNRGHSQVPGTHMCMRQWIVGIPKS